MRTPLKARSGIEIAVEHNDSDTARSFIKFLEANLLWMNHDGNLVVNRWEPSSSMAKMTEPFEHPNTHGKKSSKILDVEKMRQGGFHVM